MSVPDQLLILGNGFDLQCGLASTFSDFEEPRKDTINRIVKTYAQDENMAGTSQFPYDDQDQPGQSLATKFRAQGITVWDLILIADEQVRTWYDVEAGIRDWLMGCTEDHQPLDENQLHAVKNQYSQYRSTTTRKASLKDYVEKINLGLSIRDSFFEQLSVDEQVAKLLLEWYKCDADNNSIMKVMMQELHRLEAGFSNYMRNEADNNKNYRSCACRLLEKLMNDQLRDYDTLLTNNTYKIGGDILFGGSFNNVRILDFNYTDPIYGIKPAPTLINIHGNMHGGDIIFGIDSNSVDTNDSNYPGLVKFTKTYRLMALGKGRKTKLVHPYVSGQPGSETNIIKFFGHSLGDPDYSYFQAIFDEVNLYGSDTRLVFYYNQNRLNENKDDEKGKNTTSESAQEEMFEKVNRLISTYGQTLDNKDHGRNLMHKLLLENRLQVVQAPV